MRASELRQLRSRQAWWRNRQRRESWWRDRRNELDRMYNLVVWSLAIALMVFMIASCTPAHAYDCTTIRAYVTQYGLVKSIGWALKQGYSRADIARARSECSRTAQSTKPSWRR